MTVAVSVGAGGGAPGFGARPVRNEVEGDPAGADSFAAHMANEESREQGDASHLPAESLTPQAVQAQSGPDLQPIIGLSPFADGRALAVPVPSPAATIGGGDTAVALYDDWSVNTGIANSLVPSPIDGLAAPPHWSTLPAAMVTTQPLTEADTAHFQSRGSPTEAPWAPGTENQILRDSDDVRGNRPRTTDRTAILNGNVVGGIDVSRLTEIKPSGGPVAIRALDGVPATGRIPPSESEGDAPSTTLTAQKIAAQSRWATAVTDVNGTGLDRAPLAELAPETARNRFPEPAPGIPSKQPVPHSAFALGTFPTAIANEFSANSEMANATFRQPSPSDAAATNHDLTVGQIPPVDAHRDMSDLPYTATPVTSATSAHSKAQKIEGQSVIAPFAWGYPRTPEQADSPDFVLIGKQEERVPPITASHLPSLNSIYDTSVGIRTNAQLSRTINRLQSQSETQSIMLPVEIGLPAAYSEGLSDRLRSTTSAEQLQTAQPVWPGSRDIARQLAVGLALAPTGGTEIMLSPEELGKVRMTLLASDGAIIVQIIADRPETADLMRRHIDSLTQEFRALGYQSISFDFGPDQDRGHQAGREDDQERSAVPVPSRADAPVEDIYSAPVDVDSMGTDHRTAQLDLRM